MATVAAPARPARVRSRAIQPRHVILGSLGLMMIVVWLTRDHLLLDAGSPLRERYAPIWWLMWLHGVPGALALLLGVFQFSARLRQRHLTWHRLMGRIYVVSVFIAAPVAVIVSFKLPVPTLALASIIQAGGWLLTTGTALYCVRTGQIQQHREWMIRSYPFAMVFVVVRFVTAIPAVAAAGMLGLATTVWSTIAVACFLPSFLIEWQKLAAGRRVLKARAAARP
ncbi:MAG TPA: DUF2306 domain-containing protein [Candidatus Acidoferrales bacterium]|nr:DUF2306 domain-containing protein [Candidatus Acidoferrales bacterium]